MRAPPDEVPVQQVQDVWLLWTAPRNRARQTARPVIELLAAAGNRTVGLAKLRDFSHLELGDLHGLAAPFPLQSLLHGLHSLGPRLGCFPGGQLTATMAEPLRSCLQHHGIAECIAQPSKQGLGPLLNRHSCSLLRLSGGQLLAAREEPLCSCLKPHVAAEGATQPKAEGLGLLLARLLCGELLTAAAEPLGSCLQLHVAAEGTAQPAVERLRGTRQWFRHFQGAGLAQAGLPVVP
mmetsp:Transcript_10175/g.32272  ORF Transcript_10175/g.32272 Transcript_10175/m.32272 type:complete len:236 (+) Transcript_10175:253-960(+)